MSKDHGHLTIRLRVLGNIGNSTMMLPVLLPGVANLALGHPRRSRYPANRLGRRQPPLLDPQIGVLSRPAWLVGRDLLDDEGIGR